MPSILGWLIVGMILGPHAVHLMTQEVINSTWYKLIITWMQCTFGLMLGTELIWKKIKNYGKSLIVTTLTQSLGTFVFVSLIFGIIFYVANIPIYLALAFGGIALATAPAPALSLAAMVDLGAPLDYHLIMGAGLYTFVYIISRMCGKYGGARIGAKLCKMPITVQKYLGLTLLPHSGVSLVFTGIISSVLAASQPKLAAIVTGTVAAAAIINEIIAVIASKKGFELAGEISKQ